MSKKENIISALDWGRMPQPYLDSNGNPGTVWWKVSEALAMDCNLIQVFPNYLDNGKSVDGGQMTGDHFQKILDYCKPGLDYSHSKGIKVIFSLPMCLLYINQYDAVGEDWKQYSQITVDGINRVDTDDSNMGYACANNPLFLEKIRKCSVMSAKAGYDGMFYDAGPYSYGVRFNCHCKYCLKDWADYTKKHFGKSIPMQKENDPDLSTEEGRLLWKWRHDIFIDFMFEVLEECRKYNKDFTIWPNIGMNATHSCYYTLKGLKTSMCEYNTNKMTNPGIDSTLYFFSQYEAENPDDPLIMEFCDIGEQAWPPYKFHTAFVEALAGNGSVMASTSKIRFSALGEFVTTCNKIKESNLDAFCNSESIAETAVVYSWQEINAFHLRTGESPDFKENPPRKVASLLAAEGIPCDYIMPERVKALSDLQKYKTLIFTECNLLDKDFEKLVEEYIRKGGQVIILGESFAKQYTVDYGVKYANWKSDIFEKWTGTKFESINANRTIKSFALGNGKIHVLNKFIRFKKPLKATLALFEKAGLYNLVKVTTDIVGNVETTIRKDESGKRIWLHCITYGSNGVYDNKPTTIEVQLSEGKKVLSVSSVSPTMTEKETGLVWNQEGNKLTITATIGLWTMVTINLED